MDGKNKTNEKKNCAKFYFQRSQLVEFESVKHLANRSAKMTCLKLMADKNYGENKRTILISGKSFARMMVTLILLATTTTTIIAARTHTHTHFMFCVQRAESKVKFGWPQV